MHKLLGISSAALIAICSAANAQTTTCSRLKAECDKGAAVRGESRVPMSSCLQALPENRGVAYTGDRRTHMMDVSRK